MAVLPDPSARERAGAWARMPAPLAQRRCRRQAAAYGAAQAASGSGGGARGLVGLRRRRTRERVLPRRRRRRARDFVQEYKAFCRLDVSKPPP